MPSLILCLVEKAQAQYQIVKAFKKLLQFFLLTNSAQKSSKKKKATNFLWLLQAWLNFKKGC